MSPPALVETLMMIVFLFGFESVEFEGGSGDEEFEGVVLLDDDEVELENKLPDDDDEVKLDVNNADNGPRGVVVVGELPGMEGSFHKADYYGSLGKYSQG